VLLNLVLNAQDAMPDHGEIRITTSIVKISYERSPLLNEALHAGDYALFTVSDTGHGMDMATRLKIFYPFFTTKGLGKGTGLGLSVAMGIIKSHGGFIDLQSETGKGSVFSIYLPLVDAERVEDAPEEKDELMDTAAGTTLLVAEDDPDTLAIMDGFLKRAGYTVVTAVDGQDAVEKFAAHKDEIKLVISDVIMPRKSGKAACDEIRQMSETVKFIFISGHTRADFVADGGPGANDLMMLKPLLPFELLNKIRELLT
jgi:CheY-like chemotaxis protein